MNKLTKFLPLVALSLTPFIASAQLDGIRGLLHSAGDLIQYATIVVAGIAVLVFFWGLMKFILKIGGDAKAAEDGKKLMIWGIIALFVMVSVWGIVYFIGDQLFPGQGDDYYLAPRVPTFNQ